MDLRGSTFWALEFGGCPRFLYGAFACVAVAVAEAGVAVVAVEVVAVVVVVVVVVAAFCRSAR